MLLTTIITGSRIRTMWMTPFYLFFGTMIIYVLNNQINMKKIKKFLIGLVVLFLLSPISYAYISLTETDKRTDYPGKSIANKVQKKWDQEFNSSINVVLGNEWVAGNLSYHLKSRPKWIGFVNNENLDMLNQFLCVDDICVGRINDK